MEELPRFQDAHVLVLGDLMLDRYWQGPTSRISPEAPVPVVQVEQETLRLGGAGNVALGVAALGASVSLLAMTGDDEPAAQAAALLREQGVDAGLQVVPGARTTTKLRVMSRHQQVVRLDFEGDFTAGDHAALSADFDARLASANVVILSDYAKGALAQVPELIALANARGVPVFVDPKGTDFSRYRGATLLTPNRAEFEAVVGRCRDLAELAARGTALREALGLSALLITRGEEGMTLLAQDHAPAHMPTRAREVFDVTGAGDTVVAVLAASFAAGADLRRAVSLANVAAGLAVAKLGAVAVTRQEMVAALSVTVAETGRRICAEDVLLAELERARMRGERIVMTNGCFDILHPGHLDYLERARRLGDRLVVAVNDDASVRRLKGDQRPINTLSDRMRLLSGLTCVDWVVAFAEDTPERLYGRVLPDVLVKGDDYAEAQVAGAAVVRASGGEVVLLPCLPGHSTTDLIGKIRQDGA